MSTKRTKASMHASHQKKDNKKDTTERPIQPVELSISQQTLEVLQIPLDLIDLNPKNYRQYYDPAALNEFASGLKSVGFVISPVTVRIVMEGRYQLVVVMRRFLGAGLAGFTYLPAVVKNLTDDQVEDIQLQENIQREDPHPMNEAEGIRRMYNRNLNTAEIALRLGKSADWVYRRFKLSALIGDLQEMFLANVFTLGQAYEISDLAPEAQQRFFDRFCRDWKTHCPRLGNLGNYLSNFRCDLSEAPFDLTDTSLYPEAGACTGCRFNTA